MLTWFEIRTLSVYTVRDLIARLAQLVRASVLHTEGRGFESLSAHMSMPRWWNR